MKIVNAFAAALCLTSSFAEVQRTSEGMSANGEYLMSMKETYWQSLKDQGLMPRQVSSVLGQSVACSGGSLSVGGESFPCQDIDFESFIALRDATIPDNGGTTAGSDIWGWLSPAGEEITLWCVDNGIWFIDGTDPANPRNLGYMPSGKSRAAWCDVKVYKDTAYVVKDGNNSPNNYGIEVFDLTRLSGLSTNPNREFSPDFVYGSHERSHNLYIDTESGFLYSVGTNTCSGGLHIANLEPNPLRPTFEACVSSDGYTHDVECLVYNGPDTRYTGRQICFASNEDTVTIWDVTNKNNVQQLARLGYSGSRYTHQGWATEDLKYFIMNDELDEDRGSVSRTTTYFMNIESLTNPVLERRYSHVDTSPDHNLYVWGAVHRRGQGGNPPLGNAAPSSKYAYLSNYVAGIRVLDISVLPSEPVEVGYFDVAPDIGGTTFDGTWSNYMHPSGVLAVSSIDRGLFFLRPNMAFDNSAPVPAPTNPPADVQPTPFPTVPPTAPPTCFWIFC